MVSGPNPGDESTGLGFVYDAWNRLSALKNSGGTILATYRYNGLNQRTRKLLGSNPSSPTSTRDYYYNISWQLLETYSQASSTNPLDRYVWGVHYIDAPILRYHDHNTDGSLSSSGYDNVLYYLHDANFNVTGLVSAADGAVVERYMYKPYGKVTVLDPGWGDDANGLSDVSNDLLYCGYLYDLESGLYHVRHRYYHPTTGRWVSRDPARYLDGLGLYEYCSDNPAGTVDSSGLGWFRDAINWVKGVFRGEPEQCDQCQQAVNVVTNLGNTDPASFDDILNPIGIAAGQVFLPLNTPNVFASPEHPCGKWTLNLRDALIKAKGGDGSACYTITGIQAREHCAGWILETSKSVQLQQKFNIFASDMRQGCDRLAQSCGQQ